MLLGSFAKCNSLREVSGAMLGLSGKTANFQLNHIPKRSTLSDANKNRNVEVFAEIYNSLLRAHGTILLDSRIKAVIDKQVKIIDSSTISLFKDILNCVGRKSTTGKSKGGIKMHTSTNADEIVPNLVWFTAATTNDQKFLVKLPCDANSIYVFDKGYNDYKTFEHFTVHETGFVTRSNENAVYTEIESIPIESHIHNGVLEDMIIEIDVKKDKNTSKLKLRKVK